MVFTIKFLHNNKYSHRNTVLSIRNKTMLYVADIKDSTSFDKQRFKTKYILHRLQKLRVIPGKPRRIHFTKILFICISSKQYCLDTDYRYCIPSVHQVKYFIQNDRLKLKTKTYLILLSYSIFILSILSTKNLSKYLPSSVGYEWKRKKAKVGLKKRKQYPEH